MKVLHLINTFSAGGAELHLLTLCRYLKRGGMDVVVAYLREQVKDSRSLRPDFEKEGIRTVNLHADSRYNCSCLVRLVGLLKTEQPDILHTHLPRADCAGGIARLLSPSVLWVSSVHNIHSKSWSGKWALPLCDVLWRRADAVIAISHAVKDWLVQERNISAAQVTVIHYGIEPLRFTQPYAEQSHTAHPTGQAVIGSIGRLEPRKGHTCLIRAMPAILQQVPEAFLLIAGHDPWGYGQTLQDLIGALGLESHVRLAGFRSDIPAFLHASNVFAFASRSEGFGQVIIEAMATGRPVVASRIPPLTEIIIDGKTGLLVDVDKPQAFAQAITWLLLHPDEARNMGRRGQERVYSHFSAERMSAETLSLYTELCGEHNAQGPLV
jgi:glycosyltransferase involved in cell wall biosynthesis